MYVEDVKPILEQLKAGTEKFSHTLVSSEDAISEIHKYILDHIDP